MGDDKNPKAEEVNRKEVIRIVAFVLGGLGPSRNADVLRALLLGGSSPSEVKSYLKDFYRKTPDGIEDNITNKQIHAAFQELLLEDLVRIKNGPRFKFVQFLMLLFSYSKLSFEFTQLGLGSLYAKTVVMEKTPEEKEVSAAA